RLDVGIGDYAVVFHDVQAIYGLRLQKVPHTRYVFCNAEFIIPHPNDGSTFDLSGDNAFTLYNAIDAETMEVA
ncbi:TAT-dependent nitrous-oxide reductase, partial [Pseudomonas aeruginosa]